MRMGPITIITGILLIALGVGVYIPTEAKTALIPAYFGLALLLLGLLAGVEKIRMHVMHVAVLVGLIGFIVPAYMVTKTLLSGTVERPLAVTEQGIMAVISLIYVILCIKSFIDARRARKQQAAM